MVRKFLFFISRFNMAVSPIIEEFLLIKWIVITPGDAMDLFQVSDVISEYESNSYDAVKFILEDLPDIQFSQNNRDIFEFCFDKCNFSQIELKEL